MTSIALIDYGSGNLHSAHRALSLAASKHAGSHSIEITASPDTVRAAGRIVLPGVGHFADCAANLRAVDGLIDALEEAVLKNGTPFFGICVGQQLLATEGLEDGVTPGLNWIPGTIEKIAPGEGYRIPHMGWNELKSDFAHPILAGLGPQPHVYFTHSYAYTKADQSHIAATTHYGRDMIAAVARDNIFATQFHPEKSQAAGLKILQNFISWTPK